MLRTLLLLIAVGASELNGQQTRTSYDTVRTAATVGSDIHSEMPNDPSYLGKPLTYWLASLRNRDHQMDLAFDAIRNLGPAASIAVPDLMRIVSEPFVPIEIGVDGHNAMASKLVQFQLHSNAVDCLASIGTSAAPSAKALTEWALATKVIPVDIRNQEDQDAFVNLVGLDVLERMRVAGAIGQFITPASLVVAELLKSPNEEARKLGVAILSERALPLATTLLKSKNCVDQELGLNMLFDMWPVVAKDHLLNLTEILPCMQRDKN